MADLLAVLSFAFSVTGPIFVVLILGIALARLGLITDAFIEGGSKLVFNVTLPCLLFISISKTSIEQAANLPLLAYGALATLLVYLLLELLAAWLVHPSEERGVVVQGAFRSNMGIIGLAYCVNAYGDRGLVSASLYLACITILFNILAVVTLNRSLNTHRSILHTLAGIARNPLIIGILLALPVAWLEIELPAVVLKAGEYFAQMTLPLALLCIGGSLSLSALRYGSRNALIAAAGKLVLVPLLVSGGGWLIGLRGIDLGILFLMSSAPTAAASFVMARAMGGNPTLAANIVVLTTLGSLPFTSLGVTVLHALDLM